MSREKVQNLCKAPFRHERQTEKLDKIFGLDQLQSDLLRNQLFARAEEDVPDCEDDAVITVMLTAER